MSLTSPFCFAIMLKNYGDSMQAAIDRANKIADFVLDCIGNSDVYTSIQYFNTSWETRTHSNNEDVRVYFDDKKKIFYYPEYKFNTSSYGQYGSQMEYSRNIENGFNYFLQKDDASKFCSIPDAISEEWYFMESTVLEPEVLDLLIMIRIFADRDMPYILFYLNEIDGVIDAVHRDVRKNRTN